MGSLDAEAPGAEAHKKVFDTKSASAQSLCVHVRRELSRRYTRRAILALVLLIGAVALAAYLVRWQARVDLKLARVNLRESYTEADRSTEPGACQLFGEELYNVKEFNETHMRPSQRWIPRNGVVCYVRDNHRRRLGYCRWWERTCETCFDCWWDSELSGSSQNHLDWRLLDHESREKNALNALSADFASKSYTVKERTKATTTCKAHGKNWIGSSSTSLKCKVDDVEKSGSWSYLYWGKSLHVGKECREGCLPYCSFLLCMLGPDM